MRTSELVKRPVVTMAGDDVAQLKDVVYAAGGGEVGGFTLAGRGLFAGPMKRSLAWPRVSALGADAVMIEDESALEPPEAVLDASAASGGSGGNVLGSRVLTDAGTDLGAVVDVVIEIDEAQGGAAKCDVVGYEVEASAALTSGSGGGERKGGTRMLIPLPDTIAVSGEHLMVPAAARDFVQQDLAGFGAAVDAFRAQLEGPAT